MYINITYIYGMAILNTINDVRYNLCQGFFSDICGV